MISEDLLKISSNQAVSFVDNTSDISHSIEGNENGEVDSGFSVSPGGHKYYVPFSVEDDTKPFVNKVFESLESGIEFYKVYVNLCGFEVRRSAEKTDDDDTVISKYLLCNKSGFNENNSKSVKKRRTKSSRCGCDAKMVLKFMPGKRYYVSNFVEVHNHPSVPKDCSHFLKSNHQMSTFSMNFVFDASKVNIGKSKSFRFMKELVGGYENVGATLKDFSNFDRDLKSYVGPYDGQMLIEKFKVKKETDPSFFYDYEVDSVGHITKLFWADSTSIRNYELYGDAVSFDPTFNTNKYNMVFAPFTGVDKHNKCVTFASTLLSKEDVTHFTWAFKTFLKAMGRNPICLVIDQCPAMKQAIPAVFKATDDLPATRHRLCMWHITEKFPAKATSCAKKLISWKRLKRLYGPQV
ncbi:protein FAR1-RELATED SEQUENCE 5-like [Apium graveolens]|uniref:protein FAR1-RELATED SEQUENCE 5-like n=1 Tax=Apium graveolens TaxID=4045 RepID=UPI003D790FA5